MILGKVAVIVALILQIVIRYPYRNGMKRDNRDRQEQILLLVLTIGGLVLPFIYIFTNWLSFADYAAPQWLIYLGIVVMAISLYLFLRAHAGP